MGFLDNLGKKTSELGKKTSEATSKLAKETKLKLKINENKGKIKEVYEEIGKKVYQRHVQDNNIEDIAINEKCKLIDDLSNEIEDARKEILFLNNKKLCQKCSAEMENNAVFCPICGEKQEVVQPATENAEEAKEVEVLPKDEEVKEDAKEETEDEE